jgi:ArsR family transcriptional regulator, arsenate/arsenite/antimonite-responsive transcriptional repressor
MTLPTTTPDDIAQLLNGIRDKARLEIILLLGQTNSMNVTEIASHFRISRPAISHHLKVLKDAEIVRSEKQGQEVYYRLNSSRIVTGLREVADMIENCCQPRKP